MSRRYIFPTFLCCRYDAVSASANDHMLLPIRRDTGNSLDADIANCRRLFNAPRRLRIRVAQQATTTSAHIRYGLGMTHLEVSTQ